MLPSSHLAPINAPRPIAGSAASACSQVDDFEVTAPLGAVTEAGTEAVNQAKRAALLAGEFSEFISAAERLEGSYRSLQEEVAALGRELSKRNAALKTSLAENEQMRLALQQIVDSMPCGVLVLDRNGKIAMINPESGRLLGCGPTLTGNTAEMTLRQVSARSGINLEALCADTAETDTAQEFPIRDDHGMRWIEVRNRRLFHRPSRYRRPDQTILILRDITAQKRAEQEREAARKTMALAELTTVLAHEIRNPLASLELFSELIEKDGAQRAEWISHLRAGIRSLSGTVNNVLSFHGSGSLTLTSMELSTMIGHALAFARPIADQATVSLVWEPCEARVMGNESALQQVILNLLSNAIRHTPAGGSVTVSIRSEIEDAGKTVVVAFADTGCGIRPDQIDHIFEPGFSGSGDSSGLGLAVCERIMKQHGGGIAAANRAESGALFTLHFPVLPMESAKA